MPLSPYEWHQRFLQQARWTKNIRDYLYQRAGLGEARRVLEVGCGTGSLLGELWTRTGFSPTGLDIRQDHLSLAARSNPVYNLVQGDALSLPFSKGSFDLALCHFLLLWVSDPIRVVGEMRRVTRSRGAVLALAEPDYGGRIDYPPNLEVLGDWQRSSLKNQGANPQIGRKLGEIFVQAGLDLIEVGVLGGQWRTAPSRDEWELEWRMLISDLESLENPVPSEPRLTETASQTHLERKKEEEIKRLRSIDWTAWEAGERILFVPTFYAWGRVFE